MKSYVCLSLINFIHEKVHGFKVNIPYQQTTAVYLKLSCAMCLVLGKKRIQFQELHFMHFVTGAMNIVVWESGIKTVASQRIFQIKEIPRSLIPR